jgi:hypothetical protein
MNTFIKRQVVQIVEDYEKSGWMQISQHHTTVIKPPVYMIREGKIIKIRQDGKIMEPLWVPKM